MKINLKSKELLLILIFNQPNKKGLRSIGIDRLMFSLDASQRDIHRMIESMKSVFKEFRAEEGLLSYNINFNAERFKTFNQKKLIGPERSAILGGRKRSGGGSKVLPSRPAQRQGPSIAKINPEEMSESNRATSNP